MFGLHRSQSSVSLANDYYSPRMELARTNSIPDFTAHIRASDVYKPSWSPYYSPSRPYYPYYYSYPAQNYYKPHYKIGEPDRYYNIYSHYYNLPYRHFYFNSLHLSKSWHYPFSYFNRFRGYCCNQDYFPSYYKRL